MGPEVCPAGTGAANEIAFTYRESMAGYVRVRAHDGASRCPVEPIRFDVRCSIRDLARFARDPRHPAEMTGSVSLPHLGGTFQIDKGQFEFFSLDHRTGLRQIIYTFGFTAADGQRYSFRGRKELHHHPRRFDLLQDMTRLAGTIYHGPDATAPVHAEGELRFRLRDTPALLASMDAGPNAWWRRRIAARIAFLSVCWSALRNEYFNGLRLFYEAGYQNLVLSGDVGHPGQGGMVPFFLASGVHDKGFPWGDGEPFADLLLVISDGRGGYRRFCITERTLPGLLLDVVDGTLVYRGPLAAPQVDRAVWISSANTGWQGVSELRADISLQFESRSCGTVSYPFPFAHSLLRRISSRVVGWLESALPGTPPPGIHIGVRSVAVRSGFIRIRSISGEPVFDGAVNSSRTFGEYEHGAFRNIKRPKLGYQYRCSIQPETLSASVQVLAGTLHRQGLRGFWLDRVISKAGSVDIRVSPGSLQVERPRHQNAGHAGASAAVVHPVIEVRNSRFSSAVFERRVVELEGSQGERRLALEENMYRVRPQAVRSPRADTDVSLSAGDGLAAPERVLDRAAFDARLEERSQASAWCLKLLRVLRAPLRHTGFIHTREGR